MLKYLLATALTLCVIAGAGIYYHSRLDSLSSASASARRSREGDACLLGVSPRAEAMCPGLRESLRAILRGRAAEFRCARRLRLSCLSGEKKSARRLAEKLERLGLRVRLRPCSAVMLRSKALSGRYDLFIAPRRVILKSDIRRLGAMALEPEETESVL